MFFAVGFPSNFPRYFTTYLARSLEQLLTFLEVTDEIWPVVVVCNMLGLPFC